MAETEDTNYARPGGTVDRGPGRPRARLLKVENQKVWPETPARFFKPTRSDRILVWHIRGVSIEPLSRRVVRAAPLRVFKGRGPLKDWPDVLRAMRPGVVYRGRAIGWRTSRRMLKYGVIERFGKGYRLTGRRAPPYLGIRDWARKVQRPSLRGGHESRALVDPLALLSVPATASLDRRTAAYDGRPKRKPPRYGGGSVGDGVRS